jgi:hypothetical protein
MEIVKVKSSSWLSLLGIIIKISFLITFSRAAITMYALTPMYLLFCRAKSVLFIILNRTRLIAIKERDQLTFISKVQE